MWYKNQLSPIIICILFSFNIMSKNSYAMSAQEIFRIGIESAKIGDYSSARKEFEQALEMGLNSAALRYNLAVSFYRLELYAQAYDIFSSLLDHPNLGAVAAYNLGLTTEKQHRNDEAKRWYLRVKSMSTDNNLRELSDRALRMLNGPPAIEKRRFRFASSKLWRGSLSLKLSYDDNIDRSSDAIDRNIDAAKQLGKSAELDVTGSGYLSGNSRNGWKLFGRLYKLNYIPRPYKDSANTEINTSESDSSYAEVAASYHLKKHLWRHRVAAIASTTQLDSVLYQSARSFEVRTTRHIVNLIKLSFRYHYRDIRSTNFNYVEGEKQRFRLDVEVANGRSKKPGKKVRFSYIYELNDRNDDNYSPQRTWFRFSIDSPITSSLNMRVLIEQRSSTYDSYQVLFGANPSVRNDDRSRLRFELNYKYNREWRYTVGALYTVNDSDVEANGSDVVAIPVNSNDFDYSQNVFYTAVRWYY